MKVLLGIFSFLITAALVGLASFALIFVMIVLMNGFSEDEAKFGIGVYVVWSAFFTCLAAFGSVVSYYIFCRREMKEIASAGIALAIGVAVGMVFLAIGAAAGLIAASIARSM